MSDLAERFAAQGTRLAELQARIAALHGRLAQGPDEGVEADLASLMRERDSRLHTWALLALAWQAGGGQVQLVAAVAPAEARDPAWQQEAMLPPPETEPRRPTWSQAEIIRPERSDPAASRGIRTVSPARSGGDSPRETRAEREGSLRIQGQERATSDLAVRTLSQGEDDSDVALPEDSLDLSVLDSFVVSPSWTHQIHGTATFDVQATQDMAARLGPPAARETDEERLAEAAALDRELQRLALWTEYPRGIQRALVGLFACRLRYLQEESPSNIRSILERQIRKDFARLTQFSSDHQPGWVTGLSRQHRPETGTWLGDSEFWWKTLKRELGGFVPEAERGAINPEIALNALQTVMNERHPDPQTVRSVATRALNAGVQPEDPRLVRLLIGHLDALAGDKALKRLRRAVRRVETGEEDEDEPITTQDVLPPDWAYLARTRGHAAVMVGGEVREQRRAFIQDALGFTSLEWVSGYDIRQVQNLAERIEGGRVGFVILLARFISHKITDILLPSCRAAEVDWVVVKQGYGLSQIRVAIERYLDDPAKAAAEDEEEED